MTTTDTDLLRYLKSTVLEVCVPYREFPQTLAILSIGSVSYGIVDQYSDIDIALYYSELPSPDELESAMKANGCWKLDWVLGDRAEGGLIESYKVRGIDCQFAHTTTQHWESVMDEVLKKYEVDSPIQKALSGLLAGTPIFGEDLINEYKARAAVYPDGLALAMVKRYLAFQPMWLSEKRLKTRDALLWKQHALVEGAQNILGVLAGLNRLYFTTFQFKQMGAFIAEMRIKPPRLNERIATLFHDPNAAIGCFRDLVSDTVSLVEAHMPEVSTARVRDRLAGVENRWELPAR